MELLAVIEARGRAQFLAEPDVGLALDPEWRMAPGQIPGHVIGSVDASKVNRTTRWLADLSRARGLPDKRAIVHQFTDGMISRRSPAGSSGHRRGVERRRLRPDVVIYE